MMLKIVLRLLKRINNLLPNPKKKRHQNHKQLIKAKHQKRRSNLQRKHQKQNQKKMRKNLLVHLQHLMIQLAPQIWIFKLIKLKPLLVTQHQLNHLLLIVKTKRKIRREKEKLQQKRQIRKKILKHQNNRPKILTQLLLISIRKKIKMAGKSMFVISSKRLWTPLKLLMRVFRKNLKMQINRLK